MSKPSPKVSFKTQIQPLFKWAGGKQKMLESYHPYIYPQTPPKRFVDLFAGGLTMTLWAAENYPDAELIINDNNTELMLLYTQLRNNPEKIIKEYQTFVDKWLTLTTPERKTYYYTLREEYCQNPELKTDVRLAALLLFMMQTSFNGHWKTYIKCNRRFSTPPGNCWEKAPFFNLQKIWNIVGVLKRATLYCEDFENITLKEGDFVYADPPYRDSFVEYSEVFNEESQIRLANFLVNHKGFYAYSNKNICDGWIEKHFPNANIYDFDIKYTAGRGENVVKVKEALVTNYEPGVKPGLNV